MYKTATLVMILLSDIYTVPQSTICELQLLTVQVISFTIVLSKLTRLVWFILT